MSNLKQLNARSETLIGASKQVDKAIAHHLAQIANHVNGKGNGDTSAVNYFWSLLTAGKTSGLRADAIGNWLLAYCGVTYNDKTKKYGRKKDFQYSEQLATENPWYSFTKQAEFKPFDLEKALKALLKKAENALADTEHANEHKVSKDLLKKVEAIFDPSKDVKVPEGWDKVDGGASENGGEVTAPKTEEA